MSIDPAIHHIRRLDDDVSQLKARMERMVRFGTVPMQGGTDYSDPTKPRVRIQHGVNPDGTPALGPWLPQMHHAGEKTTWTPATPGQQFAQFAPDGVFENAVLIPLGHSLDIPSPSTDPDKHVTQYGQHGTDDGKDHFTRTIAGTTHHQDTTDHKVDVPGKIEHTAGDPSAAASTGSPAAGALMPHELNRQIQVHTARLGQIDHFVAALHDKMSSIIDLAMPVVPSLAALQPSLNHTPIGLQMAADDVLGKLPGYLSWSLLQGVAKIASTFLGSVVENAQGQASSGLSALIGQAEAALAKAIQPPPPPPPPPAAPGTTPVPVPVDTNLYFTADQEATAANLVVQASAAVAAAASGGTFELAAQLALMSSLATGTPAAAPLASVVGQMLGIMSSTAGLMSGLSGFLDSQTNSAAGTIKSSLLGGYG